MSNTVPSNVTPFPVITPGYRLVPALVGTPGSQQTVYIECPNWCVLDHIAEADRNLEDVHHYGERRALILPTQYGASTVIEVFLAQWPSAGDADNGLPYLAVDTDREVNSYHRPAALAFADQLVAFAADVRGLVRGLPDGIPADSDPNMDEALRRVRGGAA